MEVWKQYKDTQYAVSTHGRLMNLLTQKLLAGSISRQGYVKFGMWHLAKCTTVAVHRLVAETFLPNPENKPHVNHIDGVKHNNAVLNLEWTTVSENVKHAYATGLALQGAESPHSKICEADVIEMRRIFANKEMSVAEVARQFGISAAAVSHIKNGETWKSVGGEITKAPYWCGKLSPEDIPVIRSMIASGKKDKEIADAFGVNHGSINGIRHGKNWKNY